MDISHEEYLDQNLIPIIKDIVQARETCTYITNGPFQTYKRLVRTQFADGALAGISVHDMPMNNVIRKAFDILLKQSEEQK